MSPLTAALTHVDHVESQLKALNKLGARQDDGWLGMLYRGGRKHLEAMAELAAPDLPAAKPVGDDLPAYWAWSTQQGLRRKARKYLDAVALIAATEPVAVAEARAAEAAWKASQ